MAESEDFTEGKTSKHYINAVDFDAIDSVCGGICEEIKRGAQATI